MIDFFQNLARQIPDKYFRVIRYWWLFAPSKKTKALEKIKNLPKSDTQVMYKGKPRNADWKISKDRPISYQQRLIASFGKDPFKCPKCSHTMIKVSLTYRSKKYNCFKTKFFDSS
jgi:predicted RNA-binding Zn-ribbon protein involved in translation (DUF1610 family)